MFCHIHCVYDEIHLRVSAFIQIKNYEMNIQNGGLVALVEKYAMKHYNAYAVGPRTMNEQWVFVQNLYKQWDTCVGIYLAQILRKTYATASM